MNHGKGFIASIDLLRSEGTQFTDSNPDRLIVTHLYPAVLATFSSELSVCTFETLDHPRSIRNASQHTFNFESYRCKETNLNWNLFFARQYL